MFSFMIKALKTLGVLRFWIFVSLGLCLMTAAVVTLHYFGHDRLLAGVFIVMVCILLVLGFMMTVLAYLATRATYRRVMRTLMKYKYGGPLPDRLYRRLMFYILINNGIGQAVRLAMNNRGINPTIYVGDDIWQGIPGVQDTQHTVH